MRRKWIAFYVLFAVVALGGMGLVAWLNFERPPAFSDLPEAWFDRPARGDPAAWRSAGAGVLDVETDGPIRLRIVAEPRPDVLTGPLPAGVEVRAAGGATQLVATVGGPHCPADPQGPVIEVRAPGDLIVRTRGPASVEIGQARMLMFSANGCGRLKADRIDTARLSLKGPAEVELGGVERGLDAVVRGPGRIRVARMAGALDAEVWGRGRIDIDSGFLARALLFAKGGGHIHHRGEAGAVTAEARMQAKVRIAVARGLVSGAGDVDVGRPNAPATDF